MNYNKFVLAILISFFLLSCEQTTGNKLKKINLSFDKKYKNKGFALIYNDSLNKIKKLGWNVVGVSRDTMKSHEKFISKYSFKFPLISDEDEKVCKMFDVIKEKSLYGRKYMGIDRSTFLINREMEVLNIWRNVKVKGHVEEVISFIKEL